MDRARSLSKGSYPVYMVQYAHSSVPAQRRCAIAERRDESGETQGAAAASFQQLRVAVQEAPGERGLSGHHPG